MPKSYEVNAQYEQDSKRYHRFNIDDESARVVGSVYCLKGEEVPEQIVINLKSLGERLNHG